MPSKRSVLQELTLDELRTSLDYYELDVIDRRVRVQLVDALVRSRRVRIGDILDDLSRDRLKQLCQTLGLDETAGRKADLVRRLSEGASPPAEEPPPANEPLAGDLLDARLLLKNLLDRLDADANSERPLFLSVVSKAERDALRALLQAIGRPDPSAEPVTHVAPVITPPKADAAREPLAAVLDTTALRLAASPAPGWVLCLDFGTAKSKAFAATNDEDEPKLEPLPVGQADHDLDGSVHEVSSCVWIDDDGKVFVGSEAVKLGMNYGGERDTRRPLDSLKQEISQVDPEDGAAELARKLPRDVDPTSTLTYADAITIYLAYLTDLATTALESRLGTRYVRRRFTVPSWRETQREWAGNLIGKSLLRAQLLADTFHGRWRDGIPVEQVAQSVQVAATHDDKLMWIAATESDNLSDWTNGILEALAAASARLWTDSSARDVMLVVDVGAGTTDLSLFWVVQRKGQLHRAWPIEGANGGIRQAGDTLDRLLVEALLRKGGLGLDATGERARRGLRRKGVRRLKETLFETGGITEVLVNDDIVTLTRDEFIDSEGVRKFAERIADEIQELLDGVHETWEKAAEAHGITLLLTGGGCDLPMVTSLKDRQWRLGKRVVPCRLAGRVPPRMANRFSQEFIQAYPRLAVAMGGALQMRLDEKDALSSWMGGAPTPGSLDRFPTRGN